MSYNDQLNTNNEALEAILSKVNNLPEAGDAGGSGDSGGSGSTSTLETCTVTFGTLSGGGPTNLIYYTLNDSNQPELITFYISAMGLEIIPMAFPSIQVIKNSHIVIGTGVTIPKNFSTNTTGGIACCDTEQKANTLGVKFKVDGDGTISLSYK